MKKSVKIIISAALIATLTACDNNAVTEKVTEATKQATAAATEKVTDAAKEAATAATEKAKEAATAAVEKGKEAVTEVANTATSAVTNKPSVEWGVSLWGKRRAFTEHVEKLAELVSEKTNGDFKLKVSYGGLSKNKENLDGISIGAFEMAQFCSFYHKDKNASITVTELPFSKDISLARTAEIHAAIFKHPEVVKDLARWNATLFMPTPLPQYNIIANSDKFESFDDFKGLRVRGPGGIMGVLSKLGAVKTGVPFGEVRQSMDSGVIDAATFAPHAHLATKTTAIGKWGTNNLNLGSANCPVVVNTEALAKLSPEHKAALVGSVDEAVAHYVANYENNTTGKYLAAVKENGINMVTLSAEQTAKLNELATSVRSEWIEKYKGKFNAKALFDVAQELYAK